MLEYTLRRGAECWLRLCARRQGLYWYTQAHSAFCSVQPVRLLAEQGGVCRNLGVLQPEPSGGMTLQGRLSASGFAFTPQVRLRLESPAGRMQLTLAGRRVLLEPFCPEKPFQDAEAFCLWRVERIGESFYWLREADDGDS